MNQDNISAQRTALMAWVDAKLKFDGHNKQQTTSVSVVLEELRGKLVDMSRVQIYNLLVAAGMPTEGRAQIQKSILAQKVELYMQEFLALDLVESSGYYQNVRLPRALLEEYNLEGYIEAAEAMHSAGSAQSHLDYLLLQQEMDPDSTSTDPNSYVCIFASSGTGKTQLAATASLTYVHATTIYLNMSEGSTQKFYRPHVDCRGSTELMASISEFINRFKGRKTPRGEVPRISANLIQNWALNDDDGTSCYVRILFHILTEERFRQEDLKIKVRLSELKQAISGKKFFVFLDEVPTQFIDEGSRRINPKFELVLCLRDTLRYLGIAPILMSTHTGAHDYVGRASRQSVSLWSSIMSALPKYAPFSEQEKGFLKDTERPLVLRLSKKEEYDGDLRRIVKAVQKKMQGWKPLAWTISPDLQLVQLFETDVDVNGEWFTSTHNLVGHHFGWLTQGGENGRKAYGCEAAVLFERNLSVAPVCAAAEPLLYLALVTWNEEMIVGDKDERIMFPLVDRKQNPLTVRGAFNLCHDNFKCKLAIENQKAEKNDGNLLEVLVHASITLASMKTGLENDSMYLGGMLLKDFIPLVRTFMIVDHFIELPKTPPLFDNLNFKWPTVPALGSSNSGLPSDLSQLHSCSVGFLDRPADKAMVDGNVYNVCRGDNKGQPFMSVECKNFRDGVDSTLLKEVFKRIARGVKCSLVFVSHVKPNSFKRTALGSLKEECFKKHEKDRVSVVFWDQGKDPVYLQVGGEQGTKKESSEAKEEVSLLVVIIAVGSIRAEVSRKRKLTYPPSANR